MLSEWQGTNARNATSDSESLSGWCDDMYVTNFSSYLYSIMVLASYLEQKKKLKEEKLHAKRISQMNKQHEKQRKSITKISQKQKEKSDYVWVCLKTFWVKYIYEIPSTLSWRPSDVCHHIRGKAWELRDDPYNLMPMTRDEHEHHHRCERTREKKLEHSVLLSNYIDHVKIQQQEDPKPLIQLRFESRGWVLWTTTSG